MINRRSMKYLLKSLLSLFFLACTLNGSLSARAEESTSATATHSAPTRGLRITTSYLNTFLNPFPPLGTSSIGPALTYEFIVSRNVNVGIFLGYRPFWGSATWTWLGYGLVMKDYLYDMIRGWGSSEYIPGRVRPYFEYGLLVASIRVPGREYYGIAHDTKLGIGLEVALDSRAHWHAVGDVAYHLTWLRYFNTDMTNLMAAELNLGIRYVW